MPIVCGVDCSTLNRPNWVAWLDDDQLTLDLYIPSKKNPIPPLLVKPGQVACVAIDAPQGLPNTGARMRAADVAANTPTKRLPQNREALQGWRAYRGLIEVGVSIFWWVQESRSGAIPGIANPPKDKPVVVETYPRYVIRRLWPSLKIPSKRNAPLDYIDAVYSRIQKMGCVCRSVIRPSVDQADAMLCALVAREYTRSGGSLEGTVGEPPTIDHVGSVLREGLIVSP